jgi:hypothetical protein
MPRWDGLDLEVVVSGASADQAVALVQLPHARLQELAEASTVRRVTSNFPGFGPSTTESLIDHHSR